MDTNNYLPHEWQDDERMRVLMGPMPGKNDSIAFKSRITFWSAALHYWCETKDKLPFTLNEAQMAFRRGTQTPACLPDIIQHMLKQGDLIPFEDFIKSRDEGVSWASWTRNILVTVPSKWAWNIAQSTFRLGGSAQNATFINRKVLQTKSEKLLNMYWRLPKSSCPFSVERVFTVEDLYSHLNTMYPLSFEDLQVILHHLASNQKIDIIEYEGKSLLKLSKPGDTEPVSITEREIAEYQLRFAEGKLKDRLESLQNESTQLRDQARDLLLSGSKVQALSLLRRKKRCEKSMEVTLSALENLSICLHQLQESELNLSVLNAFQLGADALKSCIRSSGCAEGVSEAVESLQEVLDECHDITDTISFGVASPDGASEAELERELEGLMTDGGNSETVSDGDSPKKEHLLPDIPKHNPLSPPGGSTGGVGTEAPINL